MAIKRSQNFLNQQRVDTPHLRSIESAIRNDFDDLAKGLITGPSNSFFVRGFEINMTGAIGSSSTGLQVLAADAAILHTQSDHAGTFFVTSPTEPNQILSSTTNPKVEGSFTPGALNYIGIEFTREVDDSTTAQVYFWNPTTEQEFTKTVPLAQTLDYKFVISSSIFASNVLPLAIVETDAANNVLSVEDRRPMLFRLGTAGTTTPDPSYSYPWNDGRKENNFKSTSSASSPFVGGDKQIRNEKEWKDAIMSALKEIKGTVYWYEENSGGSIVKLRQDLANMMMTGTGDISHSETIAGRINWSQDIYFNFVGSRLTYTLDANPSSTHVSLGDDQVAYIKLVRGQPITPMLIFTNGSSVVSSVGAVSWTNNVLAGDFIKQASENDTKYYKILSVDSASQVTLSTPFLETSTGISGTKAQYAWGRYQTNAVPSIDRHIKIVDRKDVPFNEDTYWLFLRQDNGGSLARVYVRGSGFGELEQGERREISDNENLDVLEYIGSPAEHISTPYYTGAIVPAVFEQFTITFPAANSITSGQYFLANSSGDANERYFWFNKDGAGGDPLLPAKYGSAIAISTGQPNTVVAAAATAVINSIGDFNAVDNLDGTVTVTLAQAGDCTDASNINVNGLSIVINTQGSGSSNNYIVDDENLTKSIKRLDKALGDFVDSISLEGYEEKIDIVSGPAVNDNELTGPISVSTIFPIPLNSRDSNIQQTYVVGSGTLAIYLNGVRLFAGSDYNEVGLSGSDSYQIQTLIILEIDDVLVFKIEGEGAGGGGGGGTYTGSNLGPVSNANVFKQLAGNQFQFRRLTAGSNITITENANDIVISSSSGVANSSVQIKTSSYTLTSIDDVILADTSSGSIILTLPDATSVNGKIYHLKKIAAANSMFVKSILGQTLDGIDIDAAPQDITVQYETISIIAANGSWYIL